MKEENQNPEESQKQPFNLGDYTYAKGDVVELDARVFESLMGFLKNVEMAETRNSYLNMVPVATKKGEVEWNPQPNPGEFFGQTPISALSMLGVAAFDLRYMLQLVHHKNAMSGKAVKASELGTFDTPKPSADLKLV